MTFGEPGASAYRRVDECQAITMTCSADWLLPQGHCDLIAIIGRDAAFRLAGAIFDPARRIGIRYVPETATGKSFSRIAEVIGEQAARQLVAAMGGTEIRITPAAAWSNRVRDASIRDYWRNGMLTAAWIAWLHNITERQVRNITRGEPRLSVAENGGRTTGTRTSPPDQ